MRNEGVQFFQKCFWTVVSSNDSTGSTLTSAQLLELVYENEMVEAS